MQPFRLEDSPGFLIARCARELKTLLREELLAAGFDVTPEQWGVLARLWEAQGRTQRELADCTCKDVATITRMLDVMEQKGLIRRERDPADRRVCRLFLTEAGAAAEGSLVPVVRGVIHEVFQCLPAEQLEALRRALETLYEYLQTRETKPQAAGAPARPLARELP